MRVVSRKPRQEYQVGARWQIAKKNKELTALRDERAGWRYAHGLSGHEPWSFRTLKEIVPMMDTKSTSSDLADTQEYDIEDLDPGVKTWFTIGDLASEFDVTLRALRFYEDKKLLAPYRDGRSRIYSRRDRARLSLILLGKRVGLSLMEIRELLDSYSKRDQGRRQLKLAYEKFLKQQELLRAQRKEIDLSLEELEENLKSMRPKLGKTA